MYGFESKDHRFSAKTLQLCALWILEILAPQPSCQGQFWTFQFQLTFHHFLCKYSFRYHSFFPRSIVPCKYLHFHKYTFLGRASNRSHIGPHIWRPSPEKRPKRWIIIITFLTLNFYVPFLRPNGFLGLLHSIQNGHLTESKLWMISDNLLWGRNFDGL